MREGQVDDALVVLRRDHHRAEVGLRRRERARGVGEAALRRDAERLAAVLERLRVEIDQRRDFDRAVRDVALQKLGAPALAEHADADVDYSLRHRACGA